MAVKKSSYTGSLSPEFALLGFLAQSASHGYLLHKRLTKDLNQIWHVSLSQTYNILNRLESAGFIKGKLLRQSKLPSRREYYLTESGKQRFENWLISPSRSSVKTIRVEFTTRLYFASLSDHELAEKIISDQRLATHKGIAKLIRVKEGIPENQIFNNLAVNLRLKQLGSILDWLEECQDVIHRQVQET